MVEDDKSIQDLVYNYFVKKEKNLFQVDIAGNGQSGLEMAYENNYDLLLLDVMLPELDGFELCREIRKSSDVPIMFITARVASALIKRSKGLVRSKVFSAGNLLLNPNNGKVFCDGDEVKLTAREYAILKVLIENKGVIISRDKLLDIVWGYNSGADERVLDTHMRNLRKALGTDGKLIKTAIRRGYIIEDQNG